MSAKIFLAQLDEFSRLTKDPHKRGAAAQREYYSMCGSFSMERGFPLGVTDGCIIGAYLRGYPFGVQYRQDTGQYLVGTYLPSLGLENFPWSASLGNRRIAGSKQFASFADEQEFEKAIRIIERTLRIN